MTNPFQSLVGLKTVADTGASVLVNDIDGISTELANALSNGDNSSAADVWAKVQRNALEKLRSLIETEMTKNADFRYTLAETSVWAFKTPVLSGLSGNLHGCRFTIPYAPYRQLKLEGLFANLIGSGSIALPVQVIDLRQGTLLKSFSVSRSTGLGPMTSFSGVLIDGQAVKSLTMDIDLNGSDIFVGVDCTGLLLTELGGPNNGITGDTDTTMATGMLATGAMTTGSFQPTDTRIWVTATIGHSLIAVINRYADRLLWAYAYICGSMLMAEKLSSSNVNLFTNTNRNRTEDQEAKFMDEAVNRVKPVARDMLKELAPTKAIAPVTERPFDPGYTSSGFV